MSNGNITVSWTTLGADQVYLKTGSTAGSLVGANAKDGGVGPLPASGSTTLTGAFNCGDMYGYVLIQPFKSDGSGSAGVVQQAPRN